MNNEFYSVDYQASGVQSFSTTAAGSDTFAGTGDSGGSLSLANGAESYTIDEFQTNSEKGDIEKGDIEKGDIANSFRALDNMGGLSHTSASVTAPCLEPLDLAQQATPITSSIGGTRGVRCFTRPTTTTLSLT
jgi:hypothetical protein